MCILSKIIRKIIISHKYLHWPFKNCIHFLYQYVGTYYINTYYNFCFSIDQSLYFKNKRKLVTGKFWNWISKYKIQRKQFSQLREEKKKMENSPFIAI